MEHRGSLSSICFDDDLGNVDSGSYGALNSSTDRLDQCSTGMQGREDSRPGGKIPQKKNSKAYSSFQRIFANPRTPPSLAATPETKQPPKPVLQRALRAFKSTPIYTPVYKLLCKLEPVSKADFDSFQEKLPPKGFPTPRKAWYNIPTKDDGSHSWPFSEVWPPEFIVDLRKHLLLFATMFVAVVVPICLVQGYAYPATQKVGNRPGYDCMHSGGFNLRGTDVSFGHLVFAQAKAIDLAWNAVVGRGMQALLIFLSCKVFYAVLMHIVERNPVTYELFAAISLTPTTTRGIPPIMKAVMVNSDMRSRLMLLWLLITTVYIAVTPILLDALSGYRAIQSTVLQLQDGAKLDVSSGFTSGAYANLTRNSPPDYLDLDPRTGLWALKAASFQLWSNATHVYFTGDYRLNTASQNATMVYSAGCFNSTTSVLLLTADHYSLFGDSDPLQLYDDPSCGAWWPLAPVIRDAYGVWSQTYLRDQRNYECVSRDVYTWVGRGHVLALSVATSLDILREAVGSSGTSTDLHVQGFSYELLLIYSCISGAWSLGTWLLYVYASVHSELCQKGRGFGTWRAIIDLSESLRETLEDRNICAYSEAELDGNVRARNMVIYKNYGRTKEHLRFGLRETGRKNWEGRLKLEWDREYG